MPDSRATTKRSPRISRHADADALAYLVTPDPGHPFRSITMSPKFSSRVTSHLPEVTNREGQQVACSAIPVRRSSTCDERESATAMRPGSA